MLEWLTSAAASGVKATAATAGMAETVQNYNGKDERAYVRCNGMSSEAAVTSTHLQALAGATVTLQSQLSPVMLVELHLECLARLLCHACFLTDLCFVTACGLFKLARAGRERPKLTQLWDASM